MHQGSCKDQTSGSMYLNSDQMGSDSLAHLACAEHGRSEAFQAYVVPHSGPRSRLGEEIEQPSEVLSAPDGTTLTTPIADSQASKAPKQNPTSQPQLATRKENKSRVLSVEWSVRALARRKETNKGTTPTAKRYHRNTTDRRTPGQRVRGSSQVNRVLFARPTSERWSGGRF